jgi:hypothetical protein
MVQLKKPSKKNPIKKTNQKNLVKMVKSKLTYPRWHFGQVGHGGKKTIWGVFLPKFLFKKIKISYNGPLLVCFHPIIFKFIAKL